MHKAQARVVFSQDLMANSVVVCVVSKEQHDIAWHDGMA
jgi:hypothetical protein